MQTRFDRNSCSGYGSRTVGISLEPWPVIGYYLILQRHILVVTSCWNSGDSSQNSGEIAFLLTPGYWILTTDTGVIDNYDIAYLT
jgi:hypothetical protein